MTELVYCVSLPARPYQRDTHGTEVEEQQHDDGGDVQPQYGGAVLAARDSSAPLLPHDQTVDEVLVQTLSFLSGKDVGVGRATKAVRMKPHAPSMPTTIVDGASTPCRRCSSA